MSSARNNILAGAFVVLGLILAVVVSFMLSDRPGFADNREFNIRFTISDGALGLKRGSPVLLAGQPVGRVLGVTFDRDADTGAAQAVVVRAQVRNDLTLFKDATVLLEKPLLGTLSTINITAVGTPGLDAQIVQDDTVRGRIAPPRVFADAGYGPEQADQVKRAIAQAEQSVRRASELIEQASPKVQTSLSDTQAMIADFKRNMEAWSKRIDTTAANLEKASGRLDPLLAKAQEGVDDAAATLAAVRTLVEENRARVDAILVNVQSATAKVDQVTVESVNAALKDGRDALAVFSGAVGRLSALIGEQSPNLRRMLANLRIMADQLKLTAVEVRSQPWRLLHKPTTKEFSNQILYDAARSYAEAASDLRAAGESMQAAASIHAAGGPDAPDLDMLSAELNEALGKYRQAERYLMDKLIQAEKK